MKKVLILGCGPSGLLAAHATVRAGYTPIVLSVKRKSELFGCQYLHSAIPGATDGQPSVVVNYTLVGTEEDYAAKVYGPETPAFVSPAKLDSAHRAWDIRAAYDWLWDRYNCAVSDIRVVPEDIEPMLEFYKPALAFSTIPAPLLCNQGHDFKFSKCWAIGDAPERGQYVPIQTMRNHVVCNGTKHVGWYRASNVFDHGTVEWPGWSRRPPIEGVVSFTKPLSTNCSCHMKLIRLGRMGCWQKGVLAHEAFYEAEKALASHRRSLGG